MPGQIEPFETPFENAGYPSKRCQFIYMSNRSAGRYSGLLPIDYDWKELGWGLAEYFPQGYTNLLRFEKIYSAHPDIATQTKFKVDNRCAPKVYTAKGCDPDRSPLNTWMINKLFMVLREPVSCNHLNDIIGEMFKVDSAIRMAQRYAKTYGRPAVVGLIIANTTWH